MNRAEPRAERERENSAEAPVRTPEQRHRERGGKGGKGRKSPPSSSSWPIAADEEETATKKTATEGPKRVGKSPEMDEILKKKRRGKKRRSEEEKHTLRKLRLSSRLGSGFGQRTPSVDRRRSRSRALGFSGKLAKWMR